MSQDPEVSPAPPSRSTKTVTGYIVIAIVLAGLAVILWRIADVFVVAFGGILLAILLRTIARLIARVTPLPQALSLYVAIGMIVVAVVLSGWVFGNLATAQITQLQQRLPEAVKKLVGSLNQSEGGRMAVEAVKHAAGNSQTLSNVGVAAGVLATGAADLLLVVFLGIYFAVDPEIYREGFLRLLPPSRRAQVRQALDDAGKALQQWLLAQGVAMLVVGVLTGVGLAIVGVPLAFALGLIAGLLEFIPVAGPIVSAIPGMLLAFVVGPEKVAWALLVYIVVQQLESNVITPLLQRWAVSLPPVVGLLAVVACTFLFGAMGVVFATPIAVVVMAMVKHLYVEDVLENGASGGFAPKAQGDPPVRRVTKRPDRPAARPSE